MGRPKNLSDHEVLTRAFQVISGVGYNTFTLKQVSRVTRLSPAALIKRFKSKRNLALRSRYAKWDAILIEIEGSQAIQELRGLHGIMGLADLIASSVHSERPGEHLKMLGEDMDHPRLRKEAARYFAWTRSLLERLIEEAVKAGEMKRSLDAAELAFHLEASIQGAIFQHGFLQDRPISEHLRKQIRFQLVPYLAQASRRRMMPRLGPHEPNIPIG